MTDEEKAAAEAKKLHDPATGLYRDKFDPASLADIERLCRLGATNWQIAEHLEVSKSTFQLWLIKYPELADVVKMGKEYPDELVKRSHFEKATGYSYTEQQAIKCRQPDGSERVEVVEVERFMPPDTTAQIFWLKNRDPDNWKDRRENHFSGGLELNHKDPDVARAGIARFLEREKQRLAEEEGGRPH